MIADIGYFQYDVGENQSKWYVSLDGNISTASGSNSDPFSSIQAAVNFASDKIAYLFQMVRMLKM